MARNKPAARKRRLGRAGKTNSPVPIWVIAKTKGRVRTTPTRRNWRTRRLKA